MLNEFCIVAEQGIAHWLHHCPVPSTHCTLTAQLLLPLFLLPGFGDDDEYPNYPEYDVIPGIPSSPVASVGPAEILSGPFTLHGVGHKLKYTAGHFQHSSFTNVTLSADTHGKPRLGDDVYKFEFQADKHY